VWSNKIGCHDDGSDGVTIFTVCLSVFFPDNILKNEAASITKMCHLEFWKPIILGLKVKVTRHKNSASMGYLHSCECWLLLVLIIFDGLFC